MPRPLTAPTLRRVCLAPGQTLRLWLPAGATLVSNGPTLKITSAPQWIAAQLLQNRQVIGEGQSLWLERGGWVQIEAPGGGELLCVAALSTDWLARSAQALRSLTRRIRTALRGKDLSGISKSG